MARKSFNGMVFVASAASLSVIATVARADTLETPAPAPASHAASSGMPHRGESMASVQREFGQPSAKHAAVGGDAPHHPPITRWDYPGYSVFFERHVVLDTVIPDHEPGLRHTDELSPGHG